MNNLYLIAHMAGENIAIAADGIESVVKVRDIVPVPAVKPFVRGLFAMRSRVLTLIDCRYFVTGQFTEIQDGQTAIVTEISGHYYGLLVDSVQDVRAPEGDEQDLPGSLSGSWQGIGTKILSVDGNSMLVVEPARFIETAVPKAA